MNPSLVVGVAAAKSYKRVPLASVPYSAVCTQDKDSPTANVYSTLLPSILRQVVFWLWEKAGRRLEVGTLRDSLASVLMRWLPDSCCGHGIVLCDHWLLCVYVHVYSIHASYLLETPVLPFVAPTLAQEFFRGRLTSALAPDI